MLAVKFDGGLSISVLRKKLLFKNKKGVKRLNFPTPPFERKDKEKVSLFLWSSFSL
jgi:hypothetical protein